MSATSPFGQYAPVVAALAALTVIGAAIFAAVSNNASAISTLHDPFLIALGAIFGGAAAVPAVNGHVAAQARAANLRLDAIHAPAATPPNA